jgi:hypothetical protein
MKTITSPINGEDFTSLTVGELKALLSRYPDDTAVFVVWEGQVKELRENYIFQDNWGPQVVWIDGEEGLNASGVLKQL